MKKSLYFLVALLFCVNSTTALSNCSQVIEDDVAGFKAYLQVERSAQVSRIPRNLQNRTGEFYIDYRDATAGIVKVLMGYKLYTLANDCSMGSNAFIDSFGTKINSYASTNGVMATLATIRDSFNNQIRVLIQTVEVEIDLHANSCKCWTERTLEFENVFKNIVTRTTTLTDSAVSNLNNLLKSFPKAITRYIEILVGEITKKCGGPQPDLACVRRYVRIEIEFFRL